MVIYSLERQKIVTLIFACLSWIVLLLRQWFGKAISDLRLQRKFSIESVVEEIILRMRTGRGLRRSLREMQRAPRWGDEVSQAFLRASVCAMTEGLADEQIETCHYGRDWIRELVRIDRAHHQTLVALKAWRDQLRLERSFEARARQVTLQVRLQAGLGVLIYVGALLMGSRSGDLWRLGWLLPMSGMLLVIGILIIFKIGRSIRWNF